MMRSAWKPVVVVAALLFLLTYLLHESRSPDLALRANIHNALQTFELHDAELTRNVLLARAGLLPNYDSLAESGRNLTRDLATLHSESLTASDSDARAQLVVTCPGVSSRNTRQIERGRALQIGQCIAAQFADVFDPRPGGVAGKAR